MPTFFSPDGNLEVWEQKPDGYFTVTEWQALHPPLVVAPPTGATLFAGLRAERDERLLETDKYILSDYPISPEELVAIKTYRRLLRDIPTQPGAPWDGGGELTPWPELPKT